MKKAALVIAYLSCVAFTKAQSPQVEWAKKLGGSSYDRANSTVVDLSGNVYTVGDFNGTVDFDPGSGIINLTSLGGYDIFISKLDASGNFVWAKRIGGISNDASPSIVVDALGYSYYTGSFSDTVDFDPGSGIFNLISTYSPIPGYQEIFISKLDPFGNLVWAKKIGGADHDYTRSIALSALGSLNIVGSYIGTVDFDPGPGTFNLSFGGSFILRLDTAGNFVWAKQTIFITYTFVTFDSKGSSYYTGTYGGTSDFDPDSGTFNLTSVGNNDIFILKLDSSGNFLWAKSLGGPLPDYGSSIVVDSLGNIYATGSFEDQADFDPSTATFYLTSAGQGDIFVTKLDASGNFVWAKAMGGSFSEGGSSIAMDNTGNVYTTGSFGWIADFDPGPGTFNLSTAGDANIFISKLDSTGKFAWAISMGSGVTDYASSIALDASDKIYISGSFEGQADFDPDSGTLYLNTAGYNDAFVLKISDTKLGLIENRNNAYCIIYPNPSNGIFKIDMESIEKVTIEIYNNIGQLRYIQSATNEINVIDFADQPDGLYIVKVVASNGRISLQKIVKQKA